MAGSIDPRCETVRGTPWPGNSAGVFGTRVAENHLGQRLPAASTGRTYGCKRSDQTSKNSCGTGAVHIWVPAFAGTICDHVSIFTYSKSPGLLLIPTLGGEIHGANSPISVTGVISDAMKSPSSADGS